MDIRIIENIIIPGIYFFLFATAFVIIILMILRFKLLSTYQARIIKTLNPKRGKEQRTFIDDIKHFYGQFIEITHKLFIKMHLIGGLKTKKLSQKLASAGWRGRYASTIYILAKPLVIIVTSFSCLWLNYNFLLPRFEINNPMIFFIVGLILGLYLTEMYVSKAIKKYRNNIKKALPDALDLMLICFEANYSNEATLEKIAGDFVNYFPELSQEFFITATELRVLPSRTLAWKNFADRTELTEINAILTALQQNDKYGTPLASALRTQIDLFRKNRVLNAERKAAKIPVFLAIPLILCFVPILFTIILSPAIIRTMGMFYE